MIRQVYLDSVMDGVEEVTTPDTQKHRVAVVINYVMRSDWRQTGALQPVQTPLDLNFVLLRQQLLWPGHATTASNLLLVYKSSKL